MSLLGFSVFIALIVLAIVLHSWLCMGLSVAMLGICFYTFYYTYGGILQRMMNTLIENINSTQKVKE